MTSDAIELRRISRAIFRRWLFVLPVTAAVALVGYLLSQRITPEFEASTSILVGRNTDPATLDEAGSEASQRVTRTLADMVRRRPVLQETVQKLNLETSWERLRERVSVEQVPETQILIVTARAESTAGAEAIARTVAREFIAFSDLVTPSDQVVIEEAHADPDQISPDVRLNTVLAGAIGFVLASGVALLVELRPGRRRRRLPDPDQDIPELGQVPPSDRLVAFSGPLSPEAEAYGRALANLHVVLGGRSNRTVLVTHRRARRHDSMAAANLAAMFAQAGARAILVDTALRRPVQHSILGGTGSPGVADYLADREARLVDLLQPTAVRGLRLLAAGTPAHNPSILLSPSRLDRLMAGLHELADVVVLDSPLDDHTAETVLLARWADAVVVVGRGPRGGLDEATAVELEEGGVRITGVLTVRPAWRVRPSAPREHRRQREEAIAAALAAAGRALSPVGPRPRPAPEPRPTPSAEEPGDVGLSWIDDPQDAWVSGSERRGNGRYQEEAEVVTSETAGEASKEPRANPPAVGAGKPVRKVVPGGRSQRRRR